MKMKIIQTARVWNLQLKLHKSTDTIDIIEHHKHADEDDPKPRVVIPHESIDEVIDQLLTLKKVIES